MAFRTGRCTNDLFCSFASGQQDLQVPADGNFVCPQCGKALSDPPAGAGRGRARLAIVTGGSLATAGAVLFFAGMFLGGRGISPSVATKELAAEPASQPRPVAPLATASGSATGAALGSPSAEPAQTPHEGNADVAAAAAADAHSPTASAAPQASPATPAPVPAAALGAAPQAAVTAAAPPPLPAATPTIQSGGPADMQLAMVEQKRPAPLAAPVTAAPMPDEADRARRGAALADQANGAQPPTQTQTQSQTQAQAHAKALAQAEQFLQAKRAQARADQAKKAQKLAEQAKNEKAAADAKRERQAAADQERQAEADRAAQEQAATQRAEQAQAVREQAAREQAAAKAPPQPPAPSQGHIDVAAVQPQAAKPAAAPAGPSRGFSTRPVAGGAPPYPAEFETDGRSGSVTVACRIQEDGHPAGCRVISARGGEPFKGAVLGWLDSGRVRYQPILHNGKPVAETHQWSLQFQPE